MPCVQLGESGNSAQRLTVLPLLTLSGGIQASSAPGQLREPVVSESDPAQRLAQLGSQQREARRWIFTTRGSQPRRMKANSGSQANRCKVSRFQAELGRYRPELCPFTGKFPAISSQPNTEFQAEHQEEWEGKDRIKRC